MSTSKALLTQKGAGSLSERELLLAWALKRPRAWVMAHPEYRPTFQERWRFWRAARRFRSGFSLAVITGEKEFCGRLFTVTRHTLVPRPATETLVAVAKKILAEHETTTPTLLIDVGTGTGCIPITLLKDMPGRFTAYATDIARRALAVARDNARRHNVPLLLLRGNLLAPVLRQLPSMVAGTLITANLPYLTRQDVATEPSIQKEPWCALVAPENGLGLYRALLEQIQKAGGVLPRPLALLMEIKTEQMNELTSLCKKIFPKTSIEYTPDLTGSIQIALLRVR